MEYISISTDEVEEAISAIEFACDLLESIEANRNRWKWVLVSFHNALQNHMVVALTHSDGSGAIDRKVWAKWVAAEERRIEEEERGVPLAKSEADFPVLKIDPFLGMVRKMRDRAIVKVDGIDLAEDSELFRILKKINFLRNEFIHFPPQSWTLFINDLPYALLQMLNFMEAIWSRSYRFSLKVGYDEQRYRHGYGKARRLLEALDDQYRKYLESIPQP